MKQLVEQHPLGCRPIKQMIADQIDGPLIHRPSNTVIACSVGAYPNRNITNPERRLVRKFADALLHFIGYRRRGESILQKQWD